MRRDRIMPDMCLTRSEGGVCGPSLLFTDSPPASPGRVAQSTSVFADTHTAPSIGNFKAPHHASAREGGGGSVLLSVSEGGGRVDIPRLFVKL